MTTNGGLALPALEQLDHSQLHEAEALASRLVHDVGKYVSRMARNLPGGKVPKALVDLLVTDLYAFEDGRSPLTLFDELSLPLDALIGNTHLKECRRMLEQIDQIEHEVRQGEKMAVHRAASLAIDVDELLRALRKAITEACHDR